MSARRNAGLAAGALRISTVIPAYNRADLIADTLKSLLGQTRPPAEIIVVDDGSTDGTYEAVEAFGRAVTLVRQENAGAGAARNNGLARATGDIIHFMDSDDISSLNTYEVQARAIEEGADLVYGPWLKTRFEGDTLLPERFVHQQHPLPQTVKMDEAVILGQWITVFQPCMFRRSLVQEVGPYRVDLKPSEDIEMLYRLSRAARRIAHTPTTVALYRVHPENQISIQYPEKRILDQANLWLALEEHINDRKDLSEGARLRFRTKKLRAADDVRPYAPDLADRLLVDVSPLDRVMLHARTQVERIMARLRSSVGRPSTTPLLGLDFLNTEQRRQIDILGYTIQDGKVQARSEPTREMQT